MKNLLAYFVIGSLALTTFSCSEEETLISEGDLSTIELTSINNASSSSSTSFDRRTGILKAPSNTLITISLAPQDVDGVGQATLSAIGRAAVSVSWTRSGGDVKETSFRMPSSGEVRFRGSSSRSSSRDEVTGHISCGGSGYSITLDGDNPYFP